MEGLGELDGGEFQSWAYGVSADGEVVVGMGSSAEGREAFIWTENLGMQNLKEILESRYELDLSGWKLISAEDISVDGTVIVGYGIHPEGFTEGWRAVLPTSEIG